jgi:hypothetical protein
MYLGNDFEWTYANALVNFANANGTAARTQMAASLLSAFGSRSSTEVGELRTATKRARGGLVVALQWATLSAARKRRWLEAINAELPEAVGATALFYLHTDGNGNAKLRVKVTEMNDMVLRDAVTIGLSLFVGDDSKWRTCLARCPLPGCGRLFVGLDKTRPTITCSKAHGNALHRAQMRLDNGRRRLADPGDRNDTERLRRRRAELAGLERELSGAKQNAQDFSSRNLWP